MEVYTSCLVTGISAFLWVAVKVEDNAPKPLPFVVKRPSHSANMNTSIIARLTILSSGSSIVWYLLNKFVVRIG